MDNIATSLLGESVYQSNNVSPDRDRFQEFVSQWDIHYRAEIERIPLFDTD